MRKYFPTGVPIKPLLIVFAAAVLTLITWLFAWPHFVMQQLEKSMVNMGQGDHMNVSFQTIQYAWPWQSLSINGLQMEINSCKQSDDFFIDFYTERLIIERFSIWDYLLERRLSISKVQIMGSTVMFFNGKESIDADFSCLALKDGEGVSVRIGLLGWPNSKLLYFDSPKINKDSSNWIGKAKLDLDISGIYMEEKDSLGMKDIRMSLSDLVYKIDNQLDEVRVKKVNFNSLVNRLSVDSIVYQTQYAKDQIAEITGVQSHWYQVSIPNIQWIGLALDSLLSRKIISFSHMQMDRANVSIYYDKRPETRIKSYKNLPHYWLQKFSLPLRSDSTSTIGNLNIVYQEHVKEWDKPGQISFDSTLVEIPAFNYNKDRYFTIITDGAFMGQTPLKSEIRVPIKDTIYDISGSLGYLRLKQINPMLAFVSDSHISSGHSHSLAFDFQHNLTGSGGGLEWQYNDLRIAINEHKDQLSLIKKVEGVVINSFIIKSDNQPGNNFRPGEIKFVRDDTRSIFHFWWKSIASGLEASVL